MVEKENGKKAYIPKTDPRPAWSEFQGRALQTLRGPKMKLSVQSVLYGQVEKVAEWASQVA